MPTQKSRTRMYSFKVASKGKASPKQLKSISNSFKRSGMPVIEVKEGNRKILRGGAERPMVRTRTGRIKRY